MALTEQRISRQFTWNKNWVDEFESPWGIIEKFRYANHASWKEIHLLFQRKDVSKKGQRLVFNDLSSWEYIDDIAFEKVFGFSLVKHYTSLLQNMTRVFTVGLETPRVYLRKNLSFCNTCISYGYHSLFHQFVLLDTCPFHLCNLLHHCPLCKGKIDYHRSTFSEAPFQCKCGHYLLKDTSQTGFPWSSSISHKIALPEFKKWMEQSEDSKVLNTLPFFETNFVKNNNQVLLNLLMVFDKRKHLDKRHQVFSHPLRLSENGKMAKDILENELYFETRLIYKSIARHFRKTILFKHQKCIKRLVKLYPDETICPFAYAYVHWRKSIEGIPNYWQVDNGFRWTKPTMFDHFYSKPDNSSLLTLFMRWKKSTTYNTTNIAMKWGVNHVAVQLLTHHFNTWLKIANELAPQRSILHSREHTYENMPFFTIYFAESEKKQVEYHLWNSLNEEKRKTLLELYCPFK